MAARKRSKRAGRPKRIIFHVTFDKREHMWKVTCPSTKYSHLIYTKAHAIQEAKSFAKAEWASGVPAQVIVHRQDGAFQIEWTYGLDFNPPKG